MLKTNFIRHGDQLVCGDQTFFREAAVYHFPHQPLFLVERVDENAVAKGLRDALAAKLSPQRYTVEVDDGEDVLIKKKEGQPDFSFELVESDVQDITIKIQSE